MKRLVVTGDDFGLAEPVNEGIVESHLRGILTTASLMVSGAAANDAVERAKAVPSLHVGLHIVVVEGRPILPAAAVPDLVDANGEFSTALVRSGFSYFLLPRVRKQLEMEIRAQFESFRRTGLAMDHVNSHNHMHVHPTVLSLILKAGRDYGLKSVRLPFEPPIRSWRASGGSLFGKLAWSLFLTPWTGLMKSRLRTAGLRSNDYIFGMSDSGAMTTDRVLRFFRHLPPGSTEIYFHPATRRCAEIDRTMPDYQHEAEFAALTSSEVREDLHRRGIQRIAFSDL
jgi:hopanoid biosynthesis associated protein HpnK